MKKTFTILHTNDMHSSFIGMGPAADYTPFTLNDDATRGGYARLAGLIAKRKEARKDQGPVLVLDAGDYSMGTPFGAATRETGGELQLMSLMGYDATTFGNHEFDLGPDGLGKSIGVAAKAGRVPAVLAANTSFAASDATLADLQRLSKEGVIRRYLAIERRGMRFGLFGVIGKEAIIYTNGGATTFTDIAASTLLANLCTDAFRNATKADIGFSVNGLMRASLTRGKAGVQIVYDVFAVAPLGYGVVDTTAGSALVTAWFNGLELKNLLEFFLVDNPAHPGEFFPRTSGMRFRYDSSRSQYDAVTAIELGDIERGYKAIDISGKDERLYSLTCPLMLGTILVAIPKYTKGKLPLVPKNKAGQPLTSRVEALDDLRSSTAQLMSPPGTVDKGSVAMGAGKAAAHEIKEWQAIMDHLRSLPVKNKGELPVIPVDARAAEVRAIKVG